MNLHKVSEEVFVALDPLVRLGKEELDLLKRQAAASPRRRARICAHGCDDDALHEMLIAFASRSYIRPHRHVGKSESFHIVEGEADVVIFDEDGAIVDLIELGPAGSGRDFFYRLSQSAFHTPLVRSDFLVLHEVTNGPFARDGGLCAPFAPPEDQPELARAYLARLAERADEFKAGRRT